MSDVLRQVLIIRHGRSTWNAEHRWQGWLDAPLTDEGVEEAAARARELAQDGVNPRVLYSSDLGRAARTAEIIAAHLEVPVVTDPGFRERGGGDWQGHTSDEIEAKWPDLFAQWIGPHDIETRIDYWDARTGGSWRFVNVYEGEEYGFHGCFHEVGDDRLVQTFTFEGVPEGVSLETIRLEDLGDGRTRLHSTSLVGSFEDRDAILASGMEVGVNEGYEKLDGLLA